ncbi:MAG: hypothetical protein Q9199_002418 [Rusavskia elegans]
MPFFLSLSVRVLVLLSLCFTVFGKERQLRAKRLEDVVEREQSVDKRGICYDDDTYESFKYWIVDSAPYCSSLLGLSDITRTVSRVSRTTTTTVSVSYATRTATTTVPAVTIFSTIFSPLLNKREAAAATTAAPNFYQENPYAYPVYAGDAPNASIAASYYSVCSCLSLKPSTVDDTSIILSTRTINGRDSQETTSYVYLQYFTIPLEYLRFVWYPTDYCANFLQFDQLLGAKSDAYDFVQRHELWRSIPLRERKLDYPPKLWVLITSRLSQYLTRFFWISNVVIQLDHYLAAFFWLPVIATPNLERNRCPDLNSTVITLEDGQAFAVVCSTEYGGPTDIGLSEKSFNDCIQDCATTNNGFSAVRCRGVTYFADRASGVVNCNFKNLAGLAEVYNNPEGISAVLIEVPLLGTTIPVPTSFPTLLATPTAFVLPEIP